MLPAPLGPPLPQRLKPRRGADVPREVIRHVTREVEERVPQYVQVPTHGPPGGASLENPHHPEPFFQVHGGGGEQFGSTSS